MKEHGAKQKDRNDGRGEKEGGDGWIEGEKKKIERWWEVVARRTFDYL